MAVNEATVSIEQLSGSAQNVAENSSSVVNLTHNAAGTTVEGQQSIDEVITQMDNIGRRTGNVQQTIENLAASSSQIRDIVSVISEIASQTNLLALNAAIEAARAGEHGRGFAVVADEVRKLAEQSQQSTTQIANLIYENEQNIGEAVTAMKAEVDDVNAGINIVGKAGKSFAKIAELINEVSVKIQEISAATYQMATGAKQMVSTVHEIDNVGRNSSSQAETVSAAVEEQSASMEEIASSSHNLSQMAQELEQAVSKFRV